MSCSYVIITCHVVMSLLHVFTYIKVGERKCCKRFVATCTAEQKTLMLLLKGLHHAMRTDAYNIFTCLTPLGETPFLSAEESMKQLTSYCSFSQVDCNLSTKLCKIEYSN